MKTVLLTMSLILGSASGMASPSPSVKSVEVPGIYANAAKCPYDTSSADKTAMSDNGKYNAKVASKEGTGSIVR